MQFFPVEHIETFQGRTSTPANTYRDYDTAMRSSIDNARNMRQDIGIMECLEARLRMAALLEYTIAPEVPESPEQKQLAVEMKKILDRTQRFTEYQRCLMEGIWYGKSAVQNMYGHEWVGGYRRVCITAGEDVDDRAWLPINGDKLVFRTDDISRLKPGQFPHQLGIRVGQGYKLGGKVGRFEVERVQGESDVEATDRGLAYFLDKETRKKVVVHRHMIEDGAFEDQLSAGSINGVGIRSRIYWNWVQKTDTLSMLISYLQRTHGGIEIYKFPEGNDRAEQSVDDAIRNRRPGRAAIKLPVPAGEDPSQYGFDIIEPGMGGIDQLMRLLNDYFGRREKCYILGQTMSSEEGNDGLGGSGRADMQLETLLQIVEYDANNLSETMTHQTLRWLQLQNFPSSAGIRLRFIKQTRAADTDKRMQMLQQVYDLNAKIKTSDVMEVAGLTSPGPTDEYLQKGDSSPALAPGQSSPPSKAQASVPDDVLPGDGDPGIQE